MVMKYDLYSGMTDQPWTCLRCGTVCQRIYCSERCAHLSGKPWERYDSGLITLETQTMLDDQAFYTYVEKGMAALHEWVDSWTES